MGQTASLFKLATGNKNCEWIYRFWANPGRPWGGIVPPSPVLAPESALAGKSGGNPGRVDLGGSPPRPSGKEVTSPPPPPGSWGALLLPSPLRTTRKPFGLCRSSLSQGSLRNPVGHKCTTCTILVWS